MQSFWWAEFLYLLIGHLILICVPRKTVAAPPIFNVTFVFLGSCCMYVVLLDAINGCWSSGSHGFVLHGFWLAGLMLGQSSSRRSTLCSCAIICLHSTLRSFIPPPQDLKIVNGVPIDVFDCFVLFSSEKWLLRAFRPGRNFPSYWTVKNITILSLCWCWLWTHRIWHDHGVFPTPCYFMNTLHLQSQKNPKVVFKDEIVKLLFCVLTLRSRIPIPHDFEHGE